MLHAVHCTECMDCAANRGCPVPSKRVAVCTSISGQCNTQYNVNTLRDHVLNQPLPLLSELVQAAGYSRPPGNYIGHEVLW